MLRRGQSIKCWVCAHTDTKGYIELRTPLNEHPMYKTHNRSEKRSGCVCIEKTTIRYGSEFDKKVREIKNSLFRQFIYINLKPRACALPPKASLVQREVARRSRDGGIVMYWRMPIPQSKIGDFCQPCRARAPFVRFADISPATGGIRPLHKGAFLGGRLPPLHPQSCISNVGAAISRPLFIANLTAT